MLKKQKYELFKEWIEKHKLFLVSRSKASEYFAKDLKKINTPFRTIFTLQKTVKCYALVETIG